MSLSNFLSRWVCSWSHLHARSRARVRARAVIGCACTAHLDALLVTTPTFDSDEDGSAIFFSRYTTPWGAYVRSSIHHRPTASTSSPRCLSHAIDRNTNRPSAELSEHFLHPHQRAIRCSVLFLAVTVTVADADRGGNDCRGDEFLGVWAVPARTPAVEMRCGCVADSNVWINKCSHLYLTMPVSVSMVLFSAILRTRISWSRYAPKAFAQRMACVSA